VQNAGPAGLNSRLNAAAVMRIARAICEPIHQLLLQARAHMPPIGRNPGAVHDAGVHGRDSRRCHRRGPPDRMVAIPGPGPACDVPVDNSPAGAGSAAGRVIPGP
jgi:hypothetical protein